MKLTPIKINPHDYPAELQPILVNAKLYDSSCSPEAKVIFVDKDNGYFLKSAPKGTLEREVAMTRYFHNKGLSANVLAYVSDEQDWLLTEKIHGNQFSAIQIFPITPQTKLTKRFFECICIIFSEIANRFGVGIFETECRHIKIQDIRFDYSANAVFVNKIVKTHWG
jgi:kanamycin kinase